MIADATRPFNVLLVEDDPGDALLIEEALLEADLARSVTQVTDGVAALEHLRTAGAKHPDLIVLDLNMPRMGGVELLSILKSDDALRVIPVVVLTTSNAPDDISVAYRSHAAAYVVKPVTLDEFTAAVQRIDSFYRETTARIPE